MAGVAGTRGQRKVPHNATSNDTSKLGISNGVGVYVGVVKDNTDGQHMGRLKVYIPQFGSSDPDDKKHWITVSYASPFAGSTSLFDLGNNVKEYSDTTKSYGMWFSQPDLGSEVLVAFSGGRTDQGFWFACLFNRGTQVSIPGIPALKTWTGEDKPAAPKNKKDKDPDLERYVEHKPMSDALTRQGLDKDVVRGITSSGATREAPSNVTGILTKGQHQFVMDDGDKDGQNKLIRLRTTNGVQILLDDVSGHIYLITKNGNSWFELSNDGQVHIYGAKDINVHSEANINLRSGKSINIEAVDNITLSAGKKVTSQAGLETHVISGNSTHITSGTTSNIVSAAGHYETAGVIHMNGPEATPATQPTQNSLSANKLVTESICTVVPEHEPWLGHAGTINPAGPSGQQLKIDPLPQLTPVTPTAKDYQLINFPKETTEPVIASVATISTSPEVIEFIKESNGFTPVNVEDPTGQIIGYGTPFTYDDVKILFDESIDPPYSSEFDSLVPSKLSGSNKLLDSVNSGRDLTESQSFEMQQFAEEFAQRTSLTQSIDDEVAAWNVPNADNTLAPNKQKFIPDQAANILSKGITPEQADQLLANDITKSEHRVKQMLAGVKSVPQNAFDAMVSMDNQLGNASYAVVGNKKIDLTGLYKQGKFQDAAKIIATDERDRTRRIAEATMMASNVYPTNNGTDVVSAGINKAASLVKQGRLNQFSGKPATTQQAVATATSYFKQTGAMPAGINTPTVLKAADTMSAATSKFASRFKGKFGY